MASKRKHLQESDDVDEPPQKIADQKSDGNDESEDIDKTDGAVFPKYDLKKFKNLPAAFIFSNIKGPSGIMKDASAMVDLFEDHLKFEVVHNGNSPVFADLTGKQFKEKIAKMNEIDYSDRGGIAVILITHGNEGGKLLFHGEDGSEKTSDIDIQMDVIEPFLCNRQLAGKPKIFIITACRGDHHHGGVEVEEQTDGNIGGHFSKNIVLPKNSDVIAVYATSEGEVAMRNNKDGSWYVQEFVDVMKKYHKKQHFLDLLVEVNRRVAEKTSEENGITKIMPDIRSQLRKQLFLK